MHVPLTQVSIRLQAFLSSQVVPSTASGFVQMPVVGLHVPGMWHASRAVHTTGLDPTQAPSTHVSVLVHAFPSLQVVPSTAEGSLQTPVTGLHVPGTWHWLLAVQTSGVPAQVPVVHTSFSVQAFPSLQLTPLGLSGLSHNPVRKLHVPGSWQLLKASQITGLVPTHTPPWQESFLVQAFPSLQGVPSVALGLLQTPFPEQVPATWH